MYASIEHHTAILVFALSSDEEQKRKKIRNGHELFNVLSEHTLKIVAKTGLPHFLITEKEQEGDSFGERFTNAIQAVFNKGYGSIITIGNDSPQLKTSHIQRAALLLTGNKSVIGPSADGGFYLMGLHRADFNADHFKDLPWQTSNLACRLKMEFSNTSHEIVILDRLFDIDDSHDLRILYQYTQQLSDLVRRIIISLLEAPASIDKPELPCIGQFRYSAHQNRGSPRPSMA